MEWGEIPEAADVIEFAVDDIFGTSSGDRERRFIITFRAVNGWDLDRLKAERENTCVGGLLVNEIVSAMFSIG